MLTYVTNGEKHSVNVEFAVTRRSDNGGVEEVLCLGCNERFNGKIAMIKHLREQFYLTLKEAKEAYESVDPHTESQKVASLEETIERYKSDLAVVRHEYDRLHEQNVRLNVERNRIRRLFNAYQSLEDETGLENCRQEILNQIIYVAQNY